MKLESGRKADGKDVRGRLLAAAVELFAAQGVAGTTVAEIAKRAGVTSAMVHYYFQTKEQLLEAVVQDKLVDGFLATMGGALVAGREPGELVAGLVWRIVEASDRMPWLPSLWVREVISEGGALRDQVIRRADLGMTERFKAQIAAAQKRGTVNPGVNSQLLLMSVIALTMLPLSLAKSWSRLPLIGPVSKDDLGRHVVALLTHGLAAGPKAAAKTKGRRNT